LPAAHAAVLLLWLQPVLATQPSSVQALPSLHTVLTSIGLPVAHLPLAQASLAVQASPSAIDAAPDACQPLHSTLAQQHGPARRAALPLAAQAEHGTDSSPFTQRQRRDCGLPVPRGRPVFGNIQAPVPNHEAPDDAAHRGAYHRETIVVSRAQRPSGPEADCADEATHESVAEPLPPGRRTADQVGAQGTSEGAPSGSNDDDCRKRDRAPHVAACRRSRAQAHEHAPNPPTTASPLPARVWRRMVPAPADSVVSWRVGSGTAGGVDRADAAGASSSPTASETSAKATRMPGFVDRVAFRIRSRRRFSNMVLRD
jgi:hypothetical protein